MKLKIYKIILNSFRKIIRFVVQVVVEVNGIISSCKSDSCSFQFHEPSTGNIISLSPTSGYGYADSSPCQQKVTIGCTNCGQGSGDVEVFFGHVKADVESVSGDVITVCPGNKYFVQVINILRV